jgi:hypothetical protein
MLTPDHIADLVPSYEFEAAAGEHTPTAWELAFSELAAAIHASDTRTAKALLLQAELEVTKAIRAAYVEGLQDDFSDLPF